MYAETAGNCLITIEDNKLKNGALRVLTTEESNEWDEIVHSFPTHDVYYLSGYAKSLQVHGDGKALLFFYDNGKCRGINVVMRRLILAEGAEQPDPSAVSRLGSEDLPGEVDWDVWSDFATPYGYGGWLVEGDGNDLFSAYENWCLEHRIVSEFVRFHPLLENQKPAASFYEVIPLGETVTMKLDSPDNVWKNLRSTNRTAIRKAIKSGVSVHNGNDPKIYEAFQPLYNSTMNQLQSEPFYYFSAAYYQCLQKDLANNAQIFYAEKDDVMIAAAIIFGCNGRMNYHLAGRNTVYDSLRATNALLYQAACWGAEHGFRTLLLGGGYGSTEDSLMHFKRTFYTGSGQRFYVGHKIFLPGVYQELVSRHSMKDKRAGFFPEYRG